MQQASYGNVHLENLALPVRASVNIPHTWLATVDTVE